jgi:hypothetical protein
MAAPLGERWKKFVEEYGPIAVGIHFIGFVIVLVGFAIAIRMGFQPQGTTGNVGLWVGAYAATKVSSPVRILVTIALTPLVAKVLRRMKTPVA